MKETTFEIGDIITCVNDAGAKDLLIKVKYKVTGIHHDGIGVYLDYKKTVYSPSRFVKRTDLKTQEQKEYEKQSFVFDQVTINEDKKTFSIPAYTCNVENTPKQYQIGIDTFQRMEANFTVEERIAFAKGNIDKYTWRKKDQDKADFEKIVVYAQWALKQLQNG